MICLTDSFFGLAFSHENPPNNARRFFDSSAACDDDSQQDSNSDTDASSNSNSTDSFISYSSSEKRQKKRRKRRRKLSHTESSSSEEDDKPPEKRISLACTSQDNNQSQDVSNTMEQDSPIQRTDVAPGNHGLTSPIANKQDMLRTRGLVQEAEDETGDDASRSSTSLETESNQQQNQIAHNNEEQTVGADVVTAETGLGEDGRDNSHAMDPLHHLAAGDDFGSTNDDIREWEKPSTNKDRILGNSLIDWASLGENMNEEPDKESDPLLSILNFLEP